MTERIGVIVVAAGRSSRMGGIDKLWLPCGPLPVLGRSIAAFAALPEITSIALVLAPEGLERVEAQRQAYPWQRVDILVQGGTTRADSVYAGLRALEYCDLVLIHDGARPLVSADLIRSGLAAARVHGAAIPAIPVADTIKRITPDGRILATLDRSVLRAVQTPQVFRYDVLMHAYEEIGAERASCTDDAMVLERLGLPVATFPGDPHNIKITTPDDLLLLKRLADPPQH